MPAVRCCYLLLYLLPITWAVLSPGRPPTTGPLLWLLSLVRMSAAGRLFRVGLSLYSAALPTLGPDSFRQL
jgi:hypothetical protein